MLHILLHILAIVGTSLLWLIFGVFVFGMLFVVLPTLAQDMLIGANLNFPLRRSRWTLDRDDRRFGVGLLLSREWTHHGFSYVGIHWGFYTITWV